MSSTKDVAKNRLTITLDGSFDGEKASQMKEDLVAAVRSMKPGFDLVLDMTNLEFLGKDESTAAVTGSKEALAKAGVGRVVRVVGGSTLAAMRIDRAGETSYDVFTAETVEEAYALLDE